MKENHIKIQNNFLQLQKENLDKFLVLVYFVRVVAVLVDIDIFIGNMF